MTKNNYENQKESLVERLVRSFGIIVLGFFLDIADLATFGAWGLYLGAVIGGLLGLYLAYAMDWGWKGQTLMVLLAGVYCMLPATELVPVASFVFACVHFFSSKKESHDE